MLSNLPERHKFPQKRETNTRQSDHCERNDKNTKDCPLFIRDERRKNDNSVFTMRQTAATKAVSKWREKTQKNVKIPAVEVLWSVGINAQRM